MEASPGLRCQFDFVGVFTAPHFCVGNARPCTVHYHEILFAEIYKEGRFVVVALHGDIETAFVAQSMEQEGMKVLILTRDEHQHRYVSNRLCRHISVNGIIVDDGAPTSGVMRIYRAFRRYGFFGGLDRLAGRCIGRIMRYPAKAREEMIRLFGRENCLAFDREDLVIRVNGINSDKSYRLIREIAPDVIAVYGTSIVSDRILDLASSMAFNLHTGISPYYRGAGCTFWPIYNREPDYIGATVHHCTSRVDGGKIFGVARAALQQDDILETLFPRSVITGASLYVKVLREWLQEPEIARGQKQDFSLGREFRASMKNWRKEGTARRLIRNGIIREYLLSRQREESL